MIVVCDYCQQPASLVTGDKVYPHRPDLADKYFWRCVRDAAWVGCHGDTSRPLGRLANAELREAKMKAHAAFDPLWRDTGRPRRYLYQWLADKLGIEVRQCHIGMFDVETCRRVVEICDQVQPVKEGSDA